MTVFSRNVWKFALVNSHTVFTSRLLSTCVKKNRSPSSWPGQGPVATPQLVSDPTFLICPLMPANSTPGLLEALVDLVVIVA